MQLVEDKKTNKDVFVPGLDGPLVSFSLFYELQPNIIKPYIVEKEYKSYKSKYEHKKHQSFYLEYCNDQWFKEKYDPQIFASWKKERSYLCQIIAKDFCSEVESGKFTNLKLKLSESDDMFSTGLGSNVNSSNVKVIHYNESSFRDKDKENEKEEEEEDAGSNKQEESSVIVKDSKDSSNINNVAVLPNAPHIVSKENLKIMQTKTNPNSIDISESPYFGFDPDKSTLFMHQIPRFISRFDILKELKHLKGFINMTVSEPMKNQNYVRYCWVSFNSEENCNSAFNALSDLHIGEFNLPLVKSKSVGVKKIMVTPPLFEEREIEDLEISFKLIQKFNKEKGIEVIIYCFNYLCRQFFLAFLGIPSSDLTN
jgi:hypothetical protein